jgi:hypothetical protein
LWVNVELLVVETGAMWWVCFRLGQCAGIWIGVVGFVVLNVELGVCELLNISSFYIRLVSLVVHLNYMKACLPYCLCSLADEQSAMVRTDKTYPMTRTNRPYTMTGTDEPYPITGTEKPYPMTKTNKPYP